MNPLSDLLRSANKAEWSSREISARAKSLGHKAGHATINNYMAGKVPRNPSDEILRALEAVFNIPLAKLQEAAGLSAAVTEIVLPPEAGRLTSRQWAAVHELIMSMVNPGGEQPVDLTMVRGGKVEKSELDKARASGSAAARRKKPGPKS